MCVCVCVRVEVTLRINYKKCVIRNSELYFCKFYLNSAEIMYVYTKYGNIEIKMLSLTRGHHCRAADDQFKGAKQK